MEDSTIEKMQLRAQSFQNELLGAAKEYHVRLYILYSWASDIDPMADKWCVKDTPEIQAIMEQFVQECDKIGDLSQIVAPFGGLTRIIVAYKRAKGLCSNSETK